MSYFRKLAYFNLIKFSILLLIIIAMATVALSKDDEWSFGDPHLNVIPRTKAETARVSDITKITNNFLTPQRFEKRPAGAATVCASLILRMRFHSRLKTSVLKTD